VNLQSYILSTFSIPKWFWNGERNVGKYEKCPELRVTHHEHERRHTENEKYMKIEGKIRKMQKVKVDSLRKMLDSPQVISLRDSYTTIA